jgi:hypothetical protein
MLSVVMLNVIMLNYFMLSVSMDKLLGRNMRQGFNSRRGCLYAVQ